MPCSTWPPQTLLPVPDWSPPVLCQHRRLYLVCAASSGVPGEDKELIISNYKLGSEHYAPCQGSKLIYLHRTGLWGSPVAAREAPRQLRDWGHCCPSNCKIPLGKRVFSGETGNGKCQRSSHSQSTRYCTASTVAELALLPKSPKYLRRGSERPPAAGTLEAVTSGHSCAGRCRSLLQGPAPGDSGRDRH